MGGRRRSVDTSGMFKSMTGHTETTPPPQEETSSGNVNRVTLPAAEYAAAPAAASKKRKTRAPRKPRDDDPQDRQTVKLGFYLTPRVYEAIQLHKALNFIGAHNDSQIVNKALAEYLSKEINALRDVDESKTKEERLRIASKKFFD